MAPNPNQIISSTCVTSVSRLVFIGIMLWELSIRQCEAFYIQSTVPLRMKFSAFTCGFDLRSTTRLFSTPDSSDSDDSTNPSQDDPPQPIDVSIDPRFTRVRLSRALGIDWGTDLSFSFVYVRSMDPSGAAYLSKQVQVGDQLCELIPVLEEEEKDNDQSSPPLLPINLLGAPFDFVMENFAKLDRSIRQVDLVFFSGTKDELKAVVAGSNSDNNNASQQQTNDVITVTVVQKGKDNQATVVKTLTARPGVNIRKLCVDNGINVYQSVTRWTNCKGKQLCGTCIVNVKDGSIHTNRKSMDEASTLRENPDSYRLSCVTFAYGDVTIETFPPVNPAQWTR